MPRSRSVQRFEPGTALPEVRRCLQAAESVLLLRGAPVQFIRVAPLGDPIEIRVRGYSLSLRKAEADCVTVERLGEGTVSG